MPAVRSCKVAQRVDELRLGEERRLHTGSVRRYVTCEGGRPLLVQLPTCYTPSGLLSDFDEGARISLVPLDRAGRDDVGALREVCDRIAEQACAGRPDLERKDRIDAETGEVFASTTRARDVRIFESEDLAADECPVLPGDTVTAIVSPDYFWRSADGERGGVCVRLVQVLLHTDRGRYRECLAEGFAPPAALVRRPSPSGPAVSKPDALHGPPPPPPPPPPPRKKTERERPKDNGFRPTVMEIVTARNALRKVK